MAKAATKTTTDKKEKAPKKPAVTKSKTVNLEQAAQTALDKLKSLNIEPQLESQLEWCIGSYRYDQNPVGLLEAVKQSITVFKAEQAKKTKGVTATFISGIEKAL